MAHAFAGIGGTAIALLMKNSIAIGFAVGYIIGVINALWLFRTAAKGVTLKPVKAGRHVAFHYYLRFFTTAAALGMLIYFRLLSPWSPVAGLSAALLVSAGVMIYSGMAVLRPSDAA
ncbi:MAG: ATP synthase subunit I [Deltaproteobacteria bacterium]|nr:ATP synthase subunit I [Deltaproteobacteria bacterium]